FGQQPTSWQSAQFWIFTATVVLLVLGNLVYQLARLGYLLRRDSHSACSREELIAIYDRPARPLAILIPSYKEELSVLLQTVLSAALMEYPVRRVVVLLDDPPDSVGDDLKALSQARELIKDLNCKFAKYNQILQAEHQLFRNRSAA